MTLKPFHNYVKDKHVRVFIDNTTAVATINHMGTSHSKACNSAGRLVWDWCVSNGIWLSAAHIPGVSNTLADKESRQALGSTEWALDRSCFAQAVQKASATPNIDLFASRLNYKPKPFVAFKPDPEASAVNAFSISSSTYSFYVFPPLSILPATQSIAKNPVRQSHRIVSHSQVANLILMAKSHENVDTSANSVTNREAHIDSTKPTKSCSPPLRQVSLIAMPGIGGFFKDCGLS